MWVFTTIGFFSIVAHRDRSDYLLVRARVRADLMALVRLLPSPRPSVQRTPHADYLFRVVGGKEAMGRVLATLTEGIDYDNFKDEVAKLQDAERARAYHNVWHALLPLQPPKLALVKPRPKPKFHPTGGMVFAEVSAAEMHAIESAKAERVASEARIAAMHPDFVARNTSDGSDIDFEDDLPEVAEDQAIEPDAGMMPRPFKSTCSLDSDGSDIVGSGECPPLDELLDNFMKECLERERLGTSEDPPPKPERHRAPGKKI